MSERSWSKPSALAGVLHVHDTKICGSTLQSFSPQLIY
jgi:hypothetical protein